MLASGYMNLDLCLKIIVVICFIATAVEINATPDPCIPGHYCIINSWSEWSKCNASCGVTGITRREKYFCCDTSRYKTLAQCLGGCSITMQWWQTYSVEIRTCGYCKHGGIFNSSLNTCECRNDYGGQCCDVTKSSMTPTTTTTAMTITTTGASTIQPTSITSSLQTAIRNDCMVSPCKNGVCVTDSLNHNLCACEDGYEGDFCDIDKDDCVSDPCLYGTCNDKVDDFQCECLIFFKGKRCSKVKTWALVVLGLLIFLILACCCWFCWCIFSKCDREEDDNKVKPIETHRPLPASKANYNSWLGHI